MQNKQRIPRNKRSLIDITVIINYLAIWLVLVLIAFGVKSAVMSALAVSPTGMAGNDMVTLMEVHNTGAAFNLFSGQAEMIIMASIAAIAVLTLIVFTASGRLSHTAVSSMSILSAGITVNTLERITQGYVIDYIKLNLAADIPMFNLPDIMIVIGAFCLLLSLCTRN